MDRLCVIRKCDECPHYNNEYWGYLEICHELDRKTDPDDIPEDCPLQPRYEE